MAEKKKTTTDSRSANSAPPYEERPWVVQQVQMSGPDATDEAAMILLIEAARHSFRLEPLAAAGILVTRG